MELDEQKPPPPPPPPPPADLEAVYRPYEDPSLGLSAQAVKEQEVFGDASVRSQQDTAALLFGDISKESHTEPPQLPGKSEVPMAPQTLDLLGEASAPSAPSAADLLGELAAPTAPSAADLLQTDSVVPVASSTTTAAKSQSPTFEELLFAPASASDAKVQPGTVELLFGDEPVSAPNAAKPQETSIEDLLLSAPLTSASSRVRADTAEYVFGDEPEDKGKDLLGLDGAAHGTVNLGDHTSEAAPGRKDRPGAPEPSAVIDLSRPVADNSAGQTREAKRAAPPSGPQAKAKSKAAAKAKAAAAHIPANAQGFGSDDVFGTGQRERSMQDDAIQAVYQMLPDQVKQQLPPLDACVNVTVADDDIEEEETPDPERSAAAQIAGDAVTGAGGELEAQHTATAVNRTTEGRWVPTYMRHQLRAGGHTTLPQAPNAHEHSADAPPPSLSQAFMDMGQELGEGAQSVMDFFAAFLSTISVQCQVCTHQSVSDVHEQVMTFGDNLCCDAATAEDGEEIIRGPLPSEAAAGLGPVRAQEVRRIPISFEKMIEMARVKLVNYNRLNLPSEFHVAIKSRELAGQVVDNSSGAEDWSFVTEVQKDIVPTNFQAQVCRSAGPLGFDALKCDERWHVQRVEARAQAEISSSPAGGNVIVALRLNIRRDPDSSNTCEVESRLFVRPRNHGNMLPLGLVEELGVVHRNFVERLTDVAHKLSEEERPLQEPEPEADLGGHVSRPEPPAVRRPEPPAVQWPAPQKAAGAVDNSMLMQLAGGI
eukprot:TRINITY_DN5318_c0_g1_i1.p1 TRINITY_DN5318_c0_g1~~TRINITY_DN5318_c0_g1_i1.p1  ORF type:complete len:765 (+),score=182.17 TRINITY_DN5318_c0_g1_i1:31-2325(+)